MFILSVNGLPGRAPTSRPAPTFTCQATIGDDPEREAEAELLRGNDAVSTV
ncbi:hypothetical protein [Streptomyces sp. NPDC127190]|uniref:hypothetical protein n=1 Tax=unclassified Streptomyces TaxID=2593676 RepID=UPI00363C7399